MNPSQNLGKSIEIPVTSMLPADNRKVYIPAVDHYGGDLIIRSLDFRNKSQRDRIPSSLNTLRMADNLHIERTSH